MTVLKQCITRACCWIAKVCAQGSPLRQAMVVCERGLLAFPLLVVLLVTAVFVCGGVVSGWQAPVCLLMTLAFMLLQRQYAWKCRLGGAGLFIAFLCLVWVLLGCFAIGGRDHMAYHYPKIFLMLKGWNPFYMNTIEDLVRITGMPAEIMRIWHLISVVNTMHIFNAAVGFFVYSPFNPHACFLFFVMVPACFALWRVMRLMRWTPVARVVTLTLIICGIDLPQSGFGSRVPLDYSVYFICLAMLASMVRILKGDNCYGELFVFSLWMMSLKQSALLACFSFWVCFSILLLWQRRRVIGHTLGILSGMGVGLVFFTVWICSTPYISSWRTYGHPLYPAYTSDAEAFPVHDITADFKDRNVDAKSMGHFGHICNAFVSPYLTQKYYAWRLGKKDFRPSCRTWSQYQKIKEPSTPLPSVFRICYLLAFCFILLCGHRDERIFITLLMISLMVVPTQYIGFRRYTPWIEALPFFAIGYLVTLLQTSLPKYARWITIHCAAPVILWGIYQGMYHFCEYVDRWSALDTALSKLGAETLVDKKMSHYDFGRLLICEQDSRLRHITRITYTQKSPFRVCYAVYMFPVALKKYDWPQGVLLYKQRLPKNATAEERERHERLFVPYTLAVTLPKLVKRRIASLWK